MTMCSNCCFLKEVQWAKRVVHTQRGCIKLASNADRYGQDSTDRTDQGPHGSWGHMLSPAFTKHLQGKCSQRGRRETGPLWPQHARWNVRLKHWVQGPELVLRRVSVACEKGYMGMCFHELHSAEGFHEPVQASPICLWDCHCTTWIGIIKTHVIL